MKNIGIIGYGNMGRVIVSSILNTEIVSPNAIMVSDSSIEKMEELKKTNINICDENKQTAEYSDVLILAVKPDILLDVVNEIKDFIKDEAIIVSIAAGITMDTIEGAFGHKTKIIRAMPNTPAMVGEAMSSLCHNKNIQEEDLKFVFDIFSSFGKVQIVDEKMMDVITAVAGSSPALVYMFIEALADGGVLQGLPRSYAYKMAAQAVLGAAKMVLETGIHPGELKDKVCSPGGTTIEAVYVLEKRGFRSSVIESVARCTEKSKYISQQNKR